MLGDSTRGPGRLRSLDALRGVAVVLMVEQHVGVWLWRGLGAGESLHDYRAWVAINAVGGFGAPLFFFLAGCGATLAMTAAGPQRRGVLVRRGLVLYAFGLIINVITPSWFSWGSFFALQLMAVGMMVGPWLHRLSPRGLVVLMVAIVVATPWIQMALETPLAIDNARMRDVSLPGGPLRLAVAEGQYPIVPWLSVVLAGMFAGRVIVRGRVRPLVLLAALATGVGGLGVGAGVLWPQTGTSIAGRALHVGLGWFPCSSAMVMLMIGLTTWVVVVAWTWERRSKLGPLHPLVTLGRASLTVFMLHVPMFREWTRPIGAWQSLSVVQTGGVIVFFVVLAAIACRVWATYGYRYGAEWWLRRLAG